MNCEVCQMKSKSKIISILYNFVFKNSSSSLGFNLKQGYLLACILPNYKLSSLFISNYKSISPNNYSVPSSSITINSFILLFCLQLNYYSRLNKNISISLWNRTIEKIIKVYLFGWISLRSTLNYLAPNTLAKRSK